MKIIKNTINWIISNIWVIIILLTMSECSSKKIKDIYCMWTVGKDICKEDGEKKIDQRTEKRDSGRSEIKIR